MRVLAAMSGGVDSAVAAARAADAGHEVTGVHLALSLNPQSYRSGARGSLRFSFGSTSTQADSEAVGAVIGEVVERGRRAGRS